MVLKIDIIYGELNIKCRLCLPSHSVAPGAVSFHIPLKATERFNRTDTLAIWRDVWGKAQQNMWNFNSILSHYTLLSSGIHKTNW